EEHIARLRFIKRLVDRDEGYGMSLEKAKELLAKLDKGVFATSVPHVPLALAPDLFLNLDREAWITRHAVLYGYLHPLVPVRWVGDSPFPDELLEDVRRTVVTLAPDDVRADLEEEASGLFGAAGDNSFLLYRDMSTDT